jgi:hypothetical protein
MGQQILSKKYVGESPVFVMRSDPHFPYFITQFYVHDFVAPPGLFNTYEMSACILKIWRTNYRKETKCTEILLHDHKQTNKK